MLHMPCPMLLSGDDGKKTRAQFEAHIATLAVDGTVSHLQTVNNDASRRVVASITQYVQGANMYGSPWGADASGCVDAEYCRAVQHALPDWNTCQAVLGSKVYVATVAPFGLSSLPSVTRNFFSTRGGDFGDVIGCFRMSRLLYFDPALGPMEMRPQQAQGPIPYDWTI